MATTWLTSSSQSGIGPLDLTLTAEPNPEDNVRDAIVVVTKVQTGEQRFHQVSQEKIDVVRIPEFDFLVLRYSWDIGGGTDFDSVTGFINTGIPGVDDRYVGWSKGMVSTVWNVDEYLIHGGDNMESGKEAVYMNMQTVLNDPNLDPGQSDIRLKIYGNWYERKGTGEVSIEFTAYKGGYMRKEGYNFINEGGEQVYQGTSLRVVNATGKENYLNFRSTYTDMATVYYDKETRDCFIQLS